MNSHFPPLHQSDSLPPPLLPLVFKSLFPLLCLFVFPRLVSFFIFPPFQKGPIPPPLLMWQIYSNDSAVALGVSRWKTNPLFFRPFSHCRTLFRPLYSLFKSFWNFFDKLVLWKTKWKDCRGLIHFLPTIPPPPPPRLQWQTLCITGCCHVDVSVIKQACYCDIHVKLFEKQLGALSFRFLAFTLHPAPRREAEFSPTLEGLSRWPHSLILLPFLHEDMHQRHSNNSPRKEEDPGKLVNISERERYISAFSLSLPSVRMWLHNEMF